MYQHPWMCSSILTRNQDSWKWRHTNFDLNSLRTLEPTWESGIFLFDTQPKKTPKLLGTSSFGEKLCNRLHYILSMPFCSSTEDFWYRKSCLLNRKSLHRQVPFRRGMYRLRALWGKNPCSSYCSQPISLILLLLSSVSPDQAKLKYFLKSQV